MNETLRGEGLACVVVLSAAALDIVTDSGGALFVVAVIAAVIWIHVINAE